MSCIADRVLVMQHGRIVESGEVNTVLEQPAHPYTQVLLRARDIERFQQNAPSGSPLVQAVNAAKWFGDFCAVHDARFGHRPRRTGRAHRRERKWQIHAGPHAHRYAPGYIRHHQLRRRNGGPRRPCQREARLRRRAQLVFQDRIRR